MTINLIHTLEGVLMMMGAQYVPEEMWYVWVPLGLFSILETISSVEA